MILYHRKAIVSFFIAFLFILNSLAFAEPGEVFKTKLENGLTVIIEEEHSAPVVSVQMWVKVGSADEQDKYAGISHVFEHMLFKGTEKRKVGQIANIIESVGGDINAYTSFDNTVYHLTVPSRYFGTGLDIISDAIQHSTFDAEELKKELDVVLEEIRMNEDNPGRNLYKSILGTAFTTHTYRRPVIGTMETVKTFTREDMVRTFKKWYIPNNMTLVIVGDVDKDQALAAIKKEFKNFEKKPDPHTKRPLEPVQKELRTEQLTQQIKEAHLGMAFHIPDIKNNDTYAIDVLEVILSGGESSRIYKKLKIEDQIVNSIGAYGMSLRDPGLFFVTATLDTENTDKTITGVLNEINRLEFEGPNPEELQKAKFNLESDFIFSRETMDGLAGKLGYYETILGDVNYEKKYLEGIRKVTPEDIKRVLKKYFVPSNMTVTTLVPKEEAALVEKATVTNAVAKAEEKAKAEFVEVKEAQEKITQVRLENGIDLIVKEVHANPTVAFYATFPGGLRFEEASRNGVGNFTASMLTRGTAKRTREELAREVEEMAGGVSGFSGWNSTGVSGKFLASFFDKGLSILADTIMNPVFPDDEIGKLKTDVIAAINRQEDYLPGYTFKLLYRELYREHPYGMPVIGTEETISALTRQDLIDHHEKFFAPQRMVLTVVGDINTPYAIEKVKAAFKDFTKTGAELTQPPVEEHQTDIRITGDIKEKEQTHIGVGFLGTTIGSEDSYPLRVMNEVLSGQGGRLFLELRDKKGLAYNVSASSREAMDKGSISLYIATSPDKKEEAVEGLMNELKKIIAEKVTNEELTRAKRSLIGSYEIGLQEVSNQSTDMANNELYGLGYDFFKKYPDKIEAVTADDVLRVAKKYLTLEAYTISVVGPNGNGGEGK
ncbi:MAG: insulinase family protein [Deltaproteobacteria bacterium]|nr:insulinase family protein [Deltaproteobacteria bacterium]